MCLIIDANVAHFFSDPPSPEALVIIDWLTTRDGSVVYGGDLARELSEAGTGIKSLLVSLNRAGRAHLISAERIEAEMSTIQSMAICRSNDHHILALARVSGARVVYTHDQNLHADVKNKNLLDNPRGSIFQTQSHKRLLKHTNGCRGA